MLGRPGKWSTTTTAIVCAKQLSDCFQYFPRSAWKAWDTAWSRHRECALNAYVIWALTRSWLSYHDQRYHSRNVVHRWGVYVILHTSYGSDRCHNLCESYAKRKLRRSRSHGLDPGETRRNKTDGKRRKGRRWDEMRWESRNPEQSLLRSLQGCGNPAKPVIMVRK